MARAKEGKQESKQQRADARMVRACSTKKGR